MNTTSMTFSFKGKRTYLHGTDMYLHVLDHVAGSYPAVRSNPMKMVIHHDAHHQADWVCVEGDSVMDRPGRGFAFFSFSDILSGWLVETEREVTSRVPYDEELIVEACRIDGNAIVLEKPVPYAPIEAVVAMNKALHHATITLVGKRWVFTNLDLVRPLSGDDLNGLSLRLLANLGNRLTKTEIRTASGVLGSIGYASVAAP